MSRVPTMEERLASAGAWITPAHAADWSTVDKQHGDLLYVGSSEALRNRLSPANHIMWSVYVYEALKSPLIRIALWFLPIKIAAVTEAGMTQVCQPLWSNNNRGGTWDWCDPDHLLAPEQIQSTIGLRAGVYAWVYLPEATPLQRVMVDDAAARMDRRTQAPQVKYCHRCFYAQLATRVECLYCGYIHTTEDTRDKVNKAFARKPKP